MIISTEQKVIGGIGLVTLLIVVGGAIIFTKGSNTTLPKDQIVTETGLHWHPNLTITIKGKKQEFPPNLGISSVSHGKIHTHATDNKEGVVHIEAQGMVAKEDIKLSNFFKTWGKEFNSTQILDKKNGEGKVKMTVNGKVNISYENYQMKDGDKIEISYE